MTLKPAIVKRIERNHGRQSRHGACLICAKDWDTCPHDVGQVETLLAMYRQEQLTKLACE